MKNFYPAIILIFSLFFHSTDAQFFKNSYALAGGVNWAKDVAELSDGCVVMVGETHADQAANRDIIVVKTTPAGNLLWVKKIGIITSTEFPMALAIGDQDEIYVAGSNWSTVSAGYLIKLNSSGVILWTRTITKTTYDNFSDLKFRNGILYLIGTTDSDTWFVKVNAAGTTLLNKVFNIGLYEKANQMTMLSDGTIGICGEVGSAFNKDSVFVLKIDSMGTQIWNRLFNVDIVNSTNGVYGFAIAELSSRQIVMTGLGWNSGTWPSTFVLKIDSLGSQSTLTFANGLSDSGSDILPCDNDAFYLLMGNCNFGCSGYVLKFDKFLNSSVIVNLGYPGGSSYNGFTGAARMSGKTNSHLLVAGYYAYGENTEMLLLKCDTNGLTNASPTFLLQSTPASGIPCDGDSVLLVAPPGFDKYEWCINQNRVFKNMNVNNDSLYVKFKGHYYCSAWQGNAISYSNAYYFSPRPQVQNLSLTSIDNRYEFCGKSMDSIRLTTNVVSSQCQWLKNDSILSGAVSSTLVVKESGYYALRVLSPWNTCDTGKTKSVYINANYVPEPVIKDSNIAVAAGFCQAIGHLLVQKNNSYSYDWAIDEIPHSNSSNLFSSPVKPGLYTCRITNTCGAKRSKPYTLYTGIQNVRVGNSIQYFGQVTGCGVGSSVLLYAPTGSSGPFQWKRNNVLLANQTAPVLNVTQNGEYRLRYYNPTCMQMLDTYPLNIKLNTTAPVLSTPSGTMSCGSGLPLAVSPVGIGITYEWFRNDISLGMTNGNPGIIALKSGKYRCKVSNPSCGTQFTNEVEIFTGFVQPVIESYSKEVCEGDSTLLKCVPYGINAQYKWYKNGVQLAGATAFNLYVKDSGNYFCEINNSCGTLVSNPVYVGKIPIPSLISVVTPGLTACKKNPPTITTNNIPGGIYKWTDSTGDELLPVLPNKFQAGSTGIYSLEVKRGLCTVKMNPVNITVLNGSVNYLYTSAYPQICNGEVLKLSAYPWQGNTYQWYKNNLALPGAVDSTLSVSTPGKYFVRISGTCGVVDTKEVPVTVKQKPTASLVANGPTSFCLGDSVQLQVNSTNPYSYQWKRNNNLIPLASSSTFSAKQQGNYKAGVYSSYGCFKETSSLQVAIPCRVEEESNENNTAVLSPNPTATYSDFTLLHDELSSGYTLHVNDIAGRVLHPRIELLSNGIRIYPNDLGLIIIRLTTSKSTYIKHLVVIQ